MCDRDATARASPNDGAMSAHEVDRLDVNVVLQRETDAFINMFRAMNRRIVEEG